MTSVICGLKAGKKPKTKIKANKGKVEEIVVKKKKVAVTKVELGDIEKTKKKMAKKIAEGAIDKAKKSSRKSDSDSKTVVESSQVAYESDDHLIVKIGTKNVLGLYIGRNRILLEDGVERDDSDNQKEFKPEDVIANLGKKPAIGSVFGVKIEPFIKKLTLPDIGEVRLYREKFTKQHFDLLKSCSETVFKLFKKHRMTSWLDNFSHIELRTKVSKYAGTFTYKRTKEGGKTDFIVINGINFDDRQYLEYVLTHEFCHGVWFRQVPDHLKSKWAGVYGKRIKRQSFDSDDLKTLLKDIQGYDGAINAFMKEMADENQVTLIKEIYSYMKRVHRLDRNDVDMLVQNNRDALEELWPEHQDISDQVNDVGSEYALTNVREFFAETMTAHLQGKKLPSDVTKACESTIQKLIR